MSDNSTTNRIADELAALLTQTQEIPLITRMTEWLDGGKPVSEQEFYVLSDHPNRTSAQKFDAVATVRHALTRDAFIANFGFAAIVAETIDELLPHGPFVEVGAGSGYLSRLLANRGAVVVATDTLDQQYDFAYGRWFDLQQMDAAEAAAQHPTSTILMSWPCMGEDWGADTLDAMIPGQKILHIGEGRHGCTGNLRLYELLDEHFDVVEHVSLPRFRGMHDQATIYRRR